MAQEPGFLRIHDLMVRRGLVTEPAASSGRLTLGRTVLGYHLQVVMSQTVGSGTLASQLLVAVYSDGEAAAVAEWRDVSYWLDQYRASWFVMVGFFFTAVGLCLQLVPIFAS